MRHLVGEGLVFAEQGRGLLIRKRINTGQAVEVLHADDDAADGRLPRFGKVNIQVKGQSGSGAGAAEAFPSTGKVFVSDALRSRDLTEDDITGPCFYTEVGGGLVVGGSATALLFGLDPKLLALAVFLGSNPATMMASIKVNEQLLRSAKGAVVMAGMNVGPQAGGGIATYMGYLF